MTTIASYRRRLLAPSKCFEPVRAVGLVATGYYHIDAAGKRIHTFPTLSMLGACPVVEYVDAGHLRLCRGDGAFPGSPKGWCIPRYQSAGL